MEITLNQPVHSTDGPFGELGDIVVDPKANAVTHLIVEPHRRHYQARLVPMSFVDVVDGVVMVSLDEKHIRSLQRVAESEFIPIGQPIELGDGWDVGIEHIVAVPYSIHAYGMTTDDGLHDHVTIEYDRIPEGEFEISHDSRVTTTDGRCVGLVAGVLAEEGRVEGVLVQTGIVGDRHCVAVPISAVQRVRNDSITLTMDKRAFGRLRPIGEPNGTHPSVLSSVEHRLAELVKWVRSKLHD